MSPAMAPPSLMAVSTPTSTPQLPAPEALDATTLDPKALATGPPGDSGAPPGASPPTGAFATVLSDQVARTALAEGPKQASPKTAGRRSDKDAVTADGAPDPAPVAGTVDPAAVDVTAAALATAPAALSRATVPGTSVTVAAADASARPEPAAAASARPEPAAAAVGKLDTRSGHDAMGSAPDPTARPPAAAHAPTPPIAEAGKAPATTAKAAAVAAGTPHLAARATASVSTGPADGGRGMDPTATTTTATTRPLATAAPASYGVRLEQAAETVRTTIAMAARQGSSSARIQLSPASLGGLQIHLQRTADGLVARVIAEHPEAAQTLAQNGDDLRRSLQQSGMTLLRLDIGSSDRRDAPAQQQPGAGGHASRGLTATGTGDGTLDAVSDTTSTQISVHDLSDTALVNVLA